MSGSGFVLWVNKTGLGTYETGGGFQQLKFNMVEESRLMIIWLVTRIQPLC